jgi:hypothetical protein
VDYNQHISAVDYQMKNKMNNKSLLWIIINISLLYLQVRLSYLHSFPGSKFKLVTFTSFKLVASTSNY